MNPLLNTRMNAFAVSWQTAVAALAAVAVLLAGCSPEAGAGTSDPVATSDVSVEDDAFQPSAIEVPAGTEVTWTWTGSSTHNVSADEFSSEPMAEGTFSYTFTDPGTYPYRCTFHGGMTGTVVVTGRERR